jgi:hypothetical protein
MQAQGLEALLASWGEIDVRHVLAAAKARLAALAVTRQAQRLLDRLRAMHDDPLQYAAVWVAPRGQQPPAGALVPPSVMCVPVVVDLAGSAATATSIRASPATTARW